jgi:hypothetical protein
MLKTVKDSCKPHDMVFDFSMAEQVEDLGELIRSEADGEAFYAKNHVTGGMRTLFEMGCKRLAKQSDQSIFELTQAMGGGKTHTMIALGLLVKNDNLRTRVLGELGIRAPFSGGRVVAITGRKHPEHFLWGEIAQQLGKLDSFGKYWQNGPAAPDEDAWIRLIGDTPTLILLDELPPYFDYATTRTVGQGSLAQVAMNALSNLFSAALKLPRLCIVLSNLSGAYEDAAKNLRTVLKTIEQEARRQAKPITPVELGGSEIYQILRKRLFAKLPSDETIENVAQAYAQAIREAEKTKTIAKSAEQVVEEIRGSYPFHPSIKDIIALFRNNESYRQTRGLMQFVARMVRSTWKREDNDVYLIGLQHLDLNDSEVRDEIIRINDLRSAIASDVAASGSAQAEVISASMGHDAGSQVGTLILCASLPSAVDAVRGMTRQRLLEYLVAPQRSAIEFADAFDHFKRDACYLHSDKAERFYLSNTENLTKRIATEADRAPQNKIDAEMRRRLNDIFEPRRKAAYQELAALPKVDDVRLNGPRVLLILSPDTKNPPEEAQRFFDSVVEKNNLCILTGDGSSIASLEQKTRKLYAIAKLQHELGIEHQEDLAQRLEKSEQDFNSTVTALFNRVYYPTKAGLTAARLQMTFTGNRWNGEEQLEKTLAGTGVNKLIVDVDKEAQALIKKAEDLLWPENQRRVPWRDIKHRALTNARWSFVPKDGLDGLRKVAVERGQWRYSDDGYIEKGPFEKPRTAVNVQERHYEEDTGTANLEVTPLHAGAHAEVYYDKKPDVSSKSQRLASAQLSTTETRLYFLAIDPKGAHETGEPYRWDNKLTITHQPREAADKRLVELRVVPKGTLKYTLTGANPAEGTVYSEPIEIGDGEVTIYCYAEEDGVTAKRTFTIPPRASGGVRIEPTKRARLKKRVEAPDTAETFKLVERSKQARAKLTGLTIEVGTGSKNATLRFGSEGNISPEDVEALIKAIRTALGDDSAEVRLRVPALEFNTGHDLDSFARDRGITLTTNEVEQ